MSSKKACPADQVFVFAWVAQVDQPLMSMPKERLPRPGKYTVVTPGLSAEEEQAVASRDARWYSLAVWLEKARPSPSLDRPSWTTCPRLYFRCVRVLSNRGTDTARSPRHLH
jgi:hypothetical protein